MKSIELSKYTAQLHDKLSKLLDINLVATDVITLEKDGKTVSVMHVDNECEDLVTPSNDDFILITAYMSLLGHAHAALPEMSNEFVEFIATTYAQAFALGELKLAAEVTEEDVVKALEYVPFTGIRCEHITRWIDKGVNCMTDVVVQDDLIMSNDGIRRLPKVYPVLIIGDLIAFNQPLRAEHYPVTHALENDDQAPVVAGSIIYKSIGEAIVTQEGNEASIVLHGDKYKANLFGVVAD